jgi:hypothetical protein
VAKILQFFFKACWTNDGHEVQLLQLEIGHLLQQELDSREYE